MDSIKWYQSAIVRQQVVMFLLGIVGLFKLSIPSEIDVEAVVTAIFAFIAAIVPVVTVLSRLFKPTPPITETAMLKTAEREAAAKAAGEQK